MTEESEVLYKSACEAKETGDLQKARELLIQAIQADPNDARYHLQLGLVCRDIIMKVEPLHNQAVLHAQHAALLKPEEIDNWIGLAEISMACLHYPEAIAAYEHAMTMTPNNASIYTLCGFAQARNGRPNVAAELYKKAISIDPEQGLAHFLLSCFYRDDNFNPELQAYHGEMGFTAKKPCRFPVESCWNAAHGFLGMNDYEKGWKYFQCRLNRNITNNGQILLTEKFKQPLWEGQTHVEDNGSMRPARVHVHTEQGLGDIFLMVRYLNEMKKLGVKITFETQSNMMRLIEHSFPEVKVIENGKSDNVFDYHVPIMSLPFVFKTMADSVPWDGAYLIPESDKIDEWRDKLKLSKDKLNIGICWNAGKRSFNAENHETEKRKSVPFEQIEKWLHTDGIHFVSLQNDRDEQFPNPGIKSFSDTAGIIHNLDIVISVDSAVANLAGAMGKEIWVMDRFDHCWRYNDIPTPWFPTVKIFRQSKPMVWDDVMIQIQDELNKLCGKMAA